jgi:hypothetical protein
MDQKMLAAEGKEPSRFASGHVRRSERERKKRPAASFEMVVGAIL